MTKITTKTREDRVAEFRAAAGDGTISNDPDKMGAVWTCLAEEMVELADAAKDWYAEPNEETRAHFVKELADVQYVLSQVAVFYEVDLEKAFVVVSDNNMTKVVDGKIKRREDGKILKPEGYKPVTTDDLRGL